MIELRKQKTPMLAAGEVQVWRVDASAAGHDRWLMLLPDEVERAREIRSGLARNEFVAGRAALRFLLGRELDCEPREVRLRVGAEGKLAVDGIEFNVAHSRGVVLIALSRAGAVGIDLELEDRTVEALDVARASFHAEEIRWIEETPESERAEIFFRCWTRKEAVMKADGRGLSIPLHGFSVCCAGDGEQCIRLDGYSDSYYVRGLPMRDGEVAALALTRQQAVVTVLELGESKGLGTEINGWGLPLSVDAPDRVTT